MWALGSMGSFFYDRVNQISSNDHFLQAVQGGPLPRALALEQLESEKDWNVLVGRMSLVEVTLMLHAIEQLIPVVQYSGPRCRYTGNLLYLYLTVNSVIGKALSSV